MNQFKYTCDELDNFDKNGAGQSKKFAEVQKRGTDYFLNGKRIIPVEDQSEFLREYYDDPSKGFCGRDRFYAKIAQEYAGISRQDIAKWLSNLETHQIHQSTVNMKISRPVVLHAEGTWAIDLTWLKEVDVDSLTTVEKDSQVVLTIVDCFSKYAWAKILPNKQAKTVSDAFRKILAGQKCSVIRSDNGSEFKSGEFEAVTSEFGIKHIFSDAYNPRQNAMIERFNKTLKMTVYRYMTQWNLTKLSNRDLQKIVTNYNNTKHTTTRQVPAVIHAGQSPEAITTARKEIKARAVKLLAANDRRFPKLRVGDTVQVARRTIGEWRKARTFKKYSYMKQWMYELFKVAEITRPTKTKASLYKLLGPDGKLINRWFLRQDLLKIDPKNQMKELEDTETFVVEKVLDKEVLPDGKVKYLVKWYGYSDKDNTWESPQDSFKEKIDEFDAAQTVPEESVEPASEEPTPPKTIRGKTTRPKKALTADFPKAHKMTLSKQIEAAAAQGANAEHTGRVTRSRAKK
jgi:hypothetical protein